MIIIFVNLRIGKRKSTSTYGKAVKHCQEYCIKTFHPSIHTTKIMSKWVIYKIIMTLRRNQ
jgi:hypothetical protein